MTKFPLLKKAGAFCISRSGRSIVSTFRLHAALGGTVYQRATESFIYYGNTGPDADSVEKWLADDEEAKKAITKFHERK